MARTIADLATDVSRKLHGTNINKLEGEFSLYDEAARAVLNDVDFYETQKTAQIANAIYTDIYDYALPTDLKGNKIMDIRPQVKRGLEDYPRQTSTLNFDRRKLLQDFTIKNNARVRTLRFNADVGNLTVLHSMDSITSNGTWTVGDDGSNLTLDSVNFVAGSGSLNFDTSGSTTTVSISNSTMTAVDLGSMEDQGSLFVWVYCPVAITSTTLDWGSSSTVYWSDTVTTPQNGTFQIGWNLIRFDWNGATKTGTADSSAIDYLKLSLTYDGNADTDYRVDNFVAQLGEIYEIDYYSKYLFRNASGTDIEEVSASTDTINLELEGYNVLLYKVLELAAPQVQAEDAGFDLQLYTEKYAETKMKYLRKYPSERRIPIQKYY